MPKTYTHKSFKTLSNAVLGSTLSILLIGACSERSQPSAQGFGDSTALQLGTSTSKAPIASNMKDFDSQGHRGARGLLPENSIAGAERAVELGMRTVELDLAVSADGQLVVSHEPHFNPTICELEGTGYDKSTSLYKLSYADIARVDCGSKGHPEYPYQVAQPSTKPLFSAFVEAADAKAKALGRELPAYNIEFKSEPDLDGAYTPLPKAFAELVLAEITRLGIVNRCNVQAFDARPLQEMHLLAPQVKLAFLVGLPASVESVETTLGFRPNVYSPHHLTLTSGQVANYHALGIKVIPWTVNDVSRMRTLIEWGVDGIITDYPDRLAELLVEFSE